MLKIGVFGGRRGEAMINWCKVTGHAAVTSVCDRDADVVRYLREKYPEAKIEFFSDFDEFLKSNIDAVVVANYATEHAPYTIRCLEAGKHVLCEVLPCQTMAEAVALVEAVEKSGLVYAYAENYCYAPATMEMRRLYRLGKLGDFEYGEGEYIHNTEYVWPMLTYGERDHWRNMMHANFYCTHSLGPLVHITGLRPVRVTGFELPYNDRTARMGKRSGVAGIEMVTFENGALVKSIHGNLDKDSMRYCMYGSKGRIESAQHDMRIGGIEKIFVNVDSYEGANDAVLKIYDPVFETASEYKKIGHVGSDFFAMEYFVDAINGKQPDELIDVYEALNMSIPGLLAYFSVLSGGTSVRIPDLRDRSQRDEWRNDNRCTDPNVAGDQLIPSYSKSDIIVPDEVYELIKKMKIND